MSLRGWIGTPVIVLPFQLLAVPSSIVPLEAQQLATTQATAAAPAAALHASSYDSVFDSLLQALPVAEQVATVTNLTIQRDAARFSLQIRQALPAHAGRRPDRRRRVPRQGRLLVHPADGDRTRTG